MEGYTNVIGSQYDFDDLDIEGRVVDEWNVEDEEKKTAFDKGSKHVEESAILSERVKLDNGQLSEVFSVVKKKGHVWYTCHVCSDTVVGLSLLRQHVDTQKHKTNLKKPVHPRTKFVKLDPKENVKLEPGEPVPPGLEEVIIKNCIIQPTLDAWKSSPLIGLEFLVELTQCSIEEEGVYYYCLLCDKTGGTRNILIHLTSIFHYMKYLSIYFPTVARKLHSLPNKKLKKSFGLLVTEIIADIEAKYGRMKPKSENHSEFSSGSKKSELQKAVYEGPHIRELDGELFDEKATAENIDKKTRELQSAQMSKPKTEVIENIDENKDSLSSLFNKNNRVDKKQLRPRDDDENRNSPDVQIVDIQLPKPIDKKKRSRSRSLSSLSTVSSSSSKGRHRGRRYRSRSRQRQRSSAYYKHRNRSRSISRSRSPSYRHHRRHSPSYSHRSYSAGRRSHDSPPRKWSHNRRDSRPYSPDSYKNKGTDRYGRSREKHDSRNDKYRNKVGEKDSPKDHQYNAEEKVRWEKFREEFKKIECAKLEKLKYHEKNPEKHPNYPSEWKSFWNRRYNELQRSGKDPSKHDFKPEWISFWTKRMKELYEEDLKISKDDLKKKFDLPEDPGTGIPWKINPRKLSPGLIDVSPPTPDKKDVIADIKTTWKAFTGSDIKEAPKRPLSPWEEDSKTFDHSPHSRKELRRYSSKSRSPSPYTMNEKLLEDMPQRKSRTSSLIFVLRKLTVLEHELGSSLAPKVFDLLSQALAYEKIKEEASLELLLDSENCVFLETVREKLIALLCAGIVPRNMVNTSRSAIKHIDIALYLASKRQRSIPVVPSAPNPQSSSFPSLSSANPTLNPYAAPILLKSEPVVVPGVGKVDKVAIAQQIAAALIEQGKTDVTEAELGQLINAVVGMAEASVNSTQPLTTANFLHQLQSIQNSYATMNQAPVIPTNNTEKIPTVQPPEQKLVSESSKLKSDNFESQPQTAFGALKLLQSAYNETNKSDGIDSHKTEAVEIPPPKTQTISDEELAAALADFNKTSKDEQPGFINKLKIANPEMYKRLCPFIPSHNFTTSDNSKRTPISIPLSKEKSEQRIKPVLSGRLSPFSSRSGGTNPTNAERIIVEDDDDDITDIQIEKDNQSAISKSNPDTSKFNSDDDDDDDDDYSFEDVYKAAHEKLRQKQVADVEANQPSGQEQNNEQINNDKPTDAGTIDVNNVDLGTSNNFTWDLNSYEKSNESIRNLQVQNQSTNLQNPQNLFESDLKQNISTHPMQSRMYSAVDNPTQGIQRQQSNIAQPAYGESSLHYKSQYGNDSSLYRQTDDYYESSRSYNSRITEEPKYFPKDQYKDQSSSLYRDPYSNPMRATSGYRNHSEYEDEYSRYRESRGLDAYSQSRQLDRPSQGPPYLGTQPYRYQTHDYPPY